MQNLFDTIASPITPLSTGGIGAIRISGEDSFKIAEKIFSKKFEAGKITHGWIIKDGVKLDEVILLPFKAPKSYTGEDVVEIQTHGSPIIVKEILNLILDSGARMADRGEFTKRAFLNHKIDLSQAEAIMDLVGAKSKSCAIVSAKNLDGALTIETSKIKEDLAQILAKIIASIDFPEDVAEVPYEEIEKTLISAKEKIENILKSADSHNILREGIKIAISGRPNVGKSSLFNRLLSLDRAIVTDIAGTTRDSIAESVDIEGICANLIDTAGIREGEDINTVEKIGIEQAKNIMQDADINLLLFDSTQGITKEDEEIFALANTEKPKILVGTKIDLEGAKTIENAINISSIANIGIDKLKAEIKNKITDLNFEDVDFITNQRQQKCLNTACEAIECALFGVLNMELQDLISIDIKSALLAIDEISGEVMTDELLNDIFSKFCIGK